MLRQVITLFRGASHSAAEGFTDRNALLILEQQIRDSAQAVAAARKAVALAMAQNAYETERHDALVARINDLETRAIAALEQEKTALAREAAAIIAQLEVECKTSKKAQDVFAKEIGRLKGNVTTAEAKLRDLQRGQRLASATDAAQKMRGSMTEDSFQSLAEAEATLMRLRRRQKEFDLTQQAICEMDPADNPARMSEKLAEAGCGEPLRANADDVLARLRKRASAPDQSDRPNDADDTIDKPAG